MGTMKVTPEMLSFDDSVNVFDLWGMDAPSMDTEFNYELDQEIGLAEDEGKDPNALGELLLTLNWDMDGYARTWAESICEAIEGELVPYGESEPALEFGEISTVEFCDVQGFGRSYAEVELKTDGNLLYKLYSEMTDGVNEIPDGHGVSGFWRTCSDEQWATIRVISALVEHLEVVDCVPEYVDVADYLHGDDLAKYTAAFD